MVATWGVPGMPGFSWQRVRSEKEAMAWWMQRADESSWVAGAGRQLLTEKQWKQFAVDCLTVGRTLASLKPSGEEKEGEKNGSNS